MLSTSAESSPSSAPAPLLVPDVRIDSLDSPKKKQGLLEMPRDAFLILLEFLAPCLAPTVASCRTSWSRYSNDPFIWKRAIDRLRETVAGRAHLERVTRSLVAKIPALGDMLPLQCVEKGAEHLAVASNKVYVACGQYRTLQVLFADDMQTVLADIKLDTLLEYLCFSPDSSSLACLLAHKCVRFEENVLLTLTVGPPGLS